jgi:hypothetical protein
MWYATIAKSETNEVAIEKRKKGIEMFVPQLWYII